MAYVKQIENRIDDLVGTWPNLEKRKMFGGVSYLVEGKMCFGIWQEYLIVRTGPELAPQRLREAGVAPFEVTGRPMKGWVMVAAEAFESNEQLMDWLKIGHRFASSLPAA